MKLLNSDIRKYETDCDISTGNLWLLLSKYSNPHPDASLYGDKFTYIGAVTSGTHPVDSNAINGWYVWATCSDSQPQDDSNGHAWIVGSADDYSTFTFSRINLDPICAKKALLVKNCETEKETELPVTLASQRLTAITTPSAPANTKEVNIYNYSNATIQFNTNLGSQSVGPNTSIEFRAGGGQNISFTGISVLAGSWTANSQVLLNYLEE